MPDPITGIGNAGPIWCVPPKSAGPAVPAEVIVETACVTEAVAAVVVEGYEEVETAPITEAVEPTAGEESASGITEAVEVASEGATTAGESVVEAPAHSLQNQLWAAAEMVAAAACEDSRPQPPVTAAPPPEVEPSPVPVPAPTAPKAIDESMPPFMTNLRDVPNNLQWAFFGGTAAFLGVVLAAIWFAVGR